MPTTFARDTLLLDGRPRSFDRDQLARAQAEARARTLEAGGVFVTKGDGTTATMLQTGQQRASAGVRGKRKAKAKPATNGKRRAKSRKRSVDPYATTAKQDRPLTTAQRSELAALSRDPHLNFDHWQTLTRGEADRLIPRLRKLAKQRSDAQQNKPKRRNQLR
jgi:hypothetical protein